MLQIELGLVWVCTTGRQAYSANPGCALQTTWNVDESLTALQ